MQNRKCWHCKKVFSTEGKGIVDCPHCFAQTFGLDAIEEKPFTISVCKYCGQPLIGVCSDPNCRLEKPETPQWERTCLDMFCKARIPDEGQFAYTKWQTDSVNPLPVCGGMPVAPKAVERDQSSLHSILQDLADSSRLLYNAHQEYLNLVHTAQRILCQPVPPQSDSQCPSTEAQLPLSLGQPKPTRVGW